MNPDPRTPGSSARPDSRPGRLWLARTGVVLAGLTVVALAGGWVYRAELSSWLYPPDPAERLYQQYREAARNGKASLTTYQAQILQRKDCRELAIRLAKDPDSLVREAAVELLLQGATPADRMAVQRTGNVTRVSYQGLDTDAIAVLNQLLEDQDMVVRHKAIRVVSGIAATSDFAPRLYEILRAGEEADRLIVAEQLPRWGEYLPALVDQHQPREVRLTIFRGACSYGWPDSGHKASPLSLGQLTDRKLFEATSRALAEPDAELRQVAIYALRFQEGAARAWCAHLRKGPPEDWKPVLQTWIEALAAEASANTSAHLRITESMLGDGKDQEASVEQIATIAHVLSQAAVAITKQLDATPPASEMSALRERLQGISGPASQAFQIELSRLQSLLRMLDVIRYHCAVSEYRDCSFTAWLPQEMAEGPAPTRMLRPYLLEQMREPLAWCRQHGTGYASRFLCPRSLIRFSSYDWPANEVRTLGKALSLLQLDTDEALRHSIRPPK